MSKIAIISDSASTIPTTLRNRYHIFQVNDPIIFGDEVYKETVDVQGLGELVKMMKEKRNSKLRYAAVDQVPTVAYCSYSRREINETTFKY